MASQSWPYTNVNGNSENAGATVTEAVIDIDLLIVGAGPAGASLACFLGHHGESKHINFLVTQHVTPC